jgi:hypothetical protein
MKDQFADLARPTNKQILAICKKIREGWSETTIEQRKTWEPPTFYVAYRYLGDKSKNRTSVVYRMR